VAYGLCGCAGRAWRGDNFRGWYHDWQRARNSPDCIRRAAKVYDIPVMRGWMMLAGSRRYFQGAYAVHDAGQREVRTSLAATPKQHQCW